MSSRPSLSDFSLDSLTQIAQTIRGLSADAVQKANSGHPGLPLGCAEMGASLYGGLLNHDPQDPQWPNRDRFILSAGHGSMLQYACLHLAGYPVTLEDLKNFRQWNSKTPGHPEFGHTEGVECTTGPLAQGLANGVGMALGAKVKAERFNTSDHTIVDHQVVVLCGDGCLMEGLSYEAASLAGHLKLDNLIVIYDSNQISLDAPTDVSFTEDVGKRFEAMGFAVKTVDGHNFEEFIEAYTESYDRQDKPSLIIAQTTIGKGSPNQQGSQKCHGTPLGEEEVQLMKQTVGLPEEKFYIPSSVQEYFQSKQQQWQKSHQAWQQTFDQWKQANTDLAKQWEADHASDLPEDLDASLPTFEVGQSLATRKSSQQVLQALAKKIPNLLGGSADLSCSNLTHLEDFDTIQANHFGGKNIYYGVREHAMGSICNGLSYYGGIRAFCATFLVFADYLRPAIRLAALTKRPVLFLFTHDSFMVGEDGPTHQPIETLASLRCLPGLTTYRPADANEVKAVYVDALKLSGPAAICLTRQGVTTLQETAALSQEGVSRGAYVLKKEAGNSPDHVILASGSEVELALETAKILESQNLSVRVVSMPSFERFEAQAKSYQDQTLGNRSAKRWALEAQVSFGWHKYLGSEGGTITMEDFGASAPGKVLQEKFGFTADQVAARILDQKTEAAS